MAGHWRRPIAGLVVAASLAASPAIAGCDGAASPWPMPAIPGAAADPGRLAALALPYAELIEAFRAGAEPRGFRRGPEYDALLDAYDPEAARFGEASGFRAAVYFGCGVPLAVVVFDSTSLTDPRDLVAGALRQLFGGRSRLAVRTVDAVIAAYPGMPVVLIGHSSGGGLASYAAAERGLPSIAFSPSRTVAAASNDGTRQLVFIVRGDPIADPSVLALRIFREPRHLRGETLWLDVEVARPLLDLHDLETLITGLRALL